MAIEKIHGYEVDVQDESSETIKKIIRGWEDHEDDFRQARHQIDEGSDKKVYLSEKVVFEKKDGNYVLRKSNKSY